MKVVLASPTEYRKNLLTTAGFEYEERPSQVDTSALFGSRLPPAGLAMSIAAQDSLSSWINNDSELILGIGTVIALENDILGIPKDRDDARRMLKMLSGTQHEVYTGVHLYGDYIELSFSDRTIVNVYSLTDEEIEKHLDYNEYRFPGGYDPGKHGILIMEDINGSVSNLLGLPVGLLMRQLRACGIRI